jgi:hypothetical protein
MQQLSLKKSFLYVLIGSVAVSALLGILAILIGDFGKFEVRILLTSLTISAASLCGLSCGAALEAQRGQVIPWAGIGLAVVGAVLVISGLWVEPHSDDYWKTAATVSIFAVACSHASLLLLARLAPRFAWSLWTAIALIFAVALLLSGAIWLDLDEEPMFRILGVVAVLDGAFTILVPIFHRLTRGDVEPEHAPPSLEEIDAEIAELRERLEELERLKRRISDRGSSHDVAEHGDGHVVAEQRASRAAQTVSSRVAPLKR